MYHYSTTTTRLIKMIACDEMESIEPLAKSGGEINYGFTKVRTIPYKSDADAADPLASASEACEVEKDPM